MTPLQHALHRLVGGHDLSVTEAYDAFASLMDGAAHDVEIAGLLTALRMKGESVDEIVGAARAMHERATPITTVHERLLDTCGTGGDQLHTFNISTATAFVVAAVGVPVPKHSNRGTSTSGSADVLEQLGVNINLTPADITRCLDELKLGFCFAPLLHNAMRFAAPIRKQLKFRTIFNLLGPLTNPARAACQLIGTNRVETAEKLARALTQLGRQHAVVVCGNDELDEVSLWGPTTAFEVTGTEVASHLWTADSFGFPECHISSLQVNSPAESAAVIRGVFAGDDGPARHMVLANAAAALFAAEHCGGDLLLAVDLASAAIDSGRVADLLDRMIQFTNSIASK